MSLLFPRLTIASPRLSSSFLHRKLIPVGRDDDREIPKVAVATGFAEEGGLALQHREGLDGAQARRLIAEAEANTTKGPRSWTVAEQSGFIFKKPSMLRAYGDLMVPVRAMSTDGGGVDDLSTDLLLNRQFMAQASELLRGEDLIAAIPMRGWLLAGRCKAGELPVMERFREIASGIAGRGGRHGLTAACFFVRKGELRGVSGDGYLSLVTSPENPWNA